MNGRERGFLLLGSHLGDPDRPVLTAAQLRTLGRRVRSMEKTTEDRDLTGQDLLNLGYSREFSQRVLALLEQERRLDEYLRRGERLHCIPVTRVSEGYPKRLRHRLGEDSPGTLWAMGDLCILERPAIALVGSRELKAENRAFAQAVGRMAAERGLALVSGNARGADRAAQDACLEAGGSVISIVADELCRQMPRENVLFLSLEDYDTPFSAQRALNRNHSIHALGNTVFVAQSDLQKGGTWDGTTKNLRFGWSKVFCFRDGSESMARLTDMGAEMIDIDDLKDFDL